MDYAALTAELRIGHPITGVYNVDAQLAADQLNMANITQIKSSITGAEIFLAADPVQYAALTAAERREWLALCSIDTLDPVVGGIAQQAIVKIFPGGKTITNLTALRKKTSNRAEQISDLLDYTGKITVSHIKKARGEI